MDQAGSEWQRFVYGAPGGMWLVVIGSASYDPPPSIDDARLLGDPASLVRIAYDYYRRQTPAAQQALADTIGVSQQQASRYLSGHTTFDPSTVSAGCWQRLVDVVLMAQADQGDVTSPPDGAAAAESDARRDAP